MTQHTNDTFGNEASRPQDAIPIEQAQHEPAEPQAEPTGDLQDLAELAETSQPTPADEASATSERAARPTRRKSSRARKSQAKEQTPLEPGRALQDLEARGFTEDEARRLIDISDRSAQSAEAREAEATLRRLMFTRWLVEHGRLDEWSA
jgi:hypothetical protein